MFYNIAHSVVFMLRKSHVWAGIDEKKESHKPHFVPQKEHDRKENQ